MRWQTKRGARFWIASSITSRVMFGLAVFLMFTGLAILFDVPQAVHPSGWALAAYAAGFGVLAVGYGFGMLWDLRLIPATLALHIGWSLFARWATAPQRLLTMTPAALRLRLTLDVLACAVLVLGGYVILVQFIHSVAGAHAALRTEVNLARKVHDALVPVVSARADGVEHYGCSLPSGMIGGDLVDVIVGEEATTFYIVDVVGHGVGAGVLMAMLRSAARTTLADGASLEGFLRHLNRTLCELNRPEVFATCAVLQRTRSGEVRYALAGHLPILYRRTSDGTVVQLDVAGLPLGLQASQAYTSVTVEAAPGDTFLLITDGLTEVFDGSGREFGLEGVQNICAEDAGDPASLVKSIVDRARAFGRQLDDQTGLAV